MTNQNSEARDYRETVFLPQTEFSMRAGLPQLEPRLLNEWAEVDLYQRLRRLRQSQNAPLYVLHDGPPYANGDIHIGHALNKILKDMVVRSRFLMGYDVDFIPGWDCHGLPIEWKIEEKFNKEGKKKGEVPPSEFRRACRDYAAGWIDIQKDQFKRLGVLGDWQGCYATMDFSTEASVTKEFHRFMMSGLLYRGSKPVMWSPVERTALADAEIEYQSHISPTIWVKFPVQNKSDISLLIWTTTPWTIPANRAISYNPVISYGLYQVTEIKSEDELGFAPWARVGESMIMADKMASSIKEAANIKSWERLSDQDPKGLICHHPLFKLDNGYGFDVPLLAGDHVTDDAGTGFVHTAPGHGLDDYNVWLKSGYSLDTIPETVDPEGAYYPNVPLFAGLKILETEGKKVGRFGDANKAVMDRLIESGNLLARGRLEHSYPHSWRSKAPVIFRNTAQWFIRMDGTDPLRDKALKAIDETEFFPKGGKNRIRSMVESRPDWLISRQRNWGTPLAMFVNIDTGEPLKDPEVNERILRAIEEGGADSWFTQPDEVFLGDGYNPDDFEKITDILDVWFDSGCTHAFTLKQPDSAYPVADLYLEGSDQHRGWFQSSLLQSTGTRGKAPYKAVLTHGFVLDEQGEKMSKSKGNVTSPLDVAKDQGVDILRLWVALSDTAEDLRIGKQILQTTVDTYRKLRNTIRYLLGALAGFNPKIETVAIKDLPPLEAMILSQTYRLDQLVRDSYEKYDFSNAIRPICEWSSLTLSALYFDIRKDCLYCDRPDSPKRVAARMVMHHVLERLLLWLGPVLCFTTEDAYQQTGAKDYHAEAILSPLPDEWLNLKEEERWQRIINVISVVTAALEEKRRDKTIGSALEAAPKIYLSDLEDLKAFDGIDAAEVFRTSQAEIINGQPPETAFIDPQNPQIGVVFAMAQGNKCARSWRILPEVGTDKDFNDLSLRDADAVRYWESRNAKMA
jgi:isoleucyl-tRNA synthetase